MALEAITMGHPWFNKALDKEGNLYEPVPAEGKHPSWKDFLKRLGRQPGIDDIINDHNQERLSHVWNGDREAQQYYEAQAYRALSGLYERLAADKAAGKEAHGTLFVFNYEPGKFDDYFVRPMNGAHKPGEEANMIDNLDAFIKEVYNMATSEAKHDGANLVDDDGSIRQMRVLLTPSQPALEQAYDKVFMNGGTSGFMYDSHIPNWEDAGARRMSAVAISLMVQNGVIGYNAERDDFYPVLLKNGVDYRLPEAEEVMYGESVRLAA
jgi:hypothetical protein